jgi:uncharacterized protein (DUF433 family)
VDSVKQSYTLTDDQIRAALGYAAERLAAETVYIVASP